MRHTLSILVDDCAGVLYRVTSLISRRGFNIESLAVGATQDPKLSRITVVVEADTISVEQISKQLHKLINVHKVNDLTTEERTDRELALFKVIATPERRHEIIEMVDVFRANIVDVGKHTLTIEATGDEDKLKAMEDLLRDYGIKEIARTGRISLARGSRE